MREQNAAAEPIHAAIVSRMSVKIVLLGNLRSPPLSHVGFVLACERFGQALQELCRGALRAAAKSNAERPFLTLWSQLRGEGDIALLGAAELPIHAEVVHQIPPTVARARVADRAPDKIWFATKGEVNSLSCRVEKSAPCKLANPARVAGPASREMRGQQGVDFQFAAQRFVGHLKTRAQQDDGAVRIGQNMFGNAVAPGRFGISQLIVQAVSVRVMDFMVQIAFFLMAEGF